MKLQLTLHATVYKTKMNEMNDRQTGQKVNWYQVVLDQGDDVDTFTCTEEVFINAHRGQECDLMAQYDSENKRFKITGIVAEPVPDTTPESTPDTTPESTPDTIPESAPETDVTAPDATPETAPESTPETDAIADNGKKKHK